MSSSTRRLSNGNERPKANTSLSGSPENRPDQRFVIFLVRLRRVSRRANDRECYERMLARERFAMRFRRRTHGDADDLAGAARQLEAHGAGHRRLRAIDERLTRFPPDARPR